MVQGQLANSPAGEILNIMQRAGSVTIKELEERLGVTTTAVRQQISSLLMDGYISQGVERMGRGRPRHVFTLTDRGRSLSPTHYDEFTKDLLREILVSEGPAKVQVLLGRIGERLARQYADQIAATGPAERATEFGRLLNAKGILAEVQVGAEGIMVQEFTCPYYGLARLHRQICDMEQDMMAHVIEQPVALVTCTLDGHNGCKFRVEPLTLESDREG